MAKSILLIWEEIGSFSQTSLVEQLKNEGIEANTVTYNVDHISKYVDDSDLFVLSATPDTINQKEMLIFLRDCCIEKEKYMCIVGYDKDVDEVRQILHDSYVVKEFYKPVDAKTLVNGLDLVLEKIGSEDNKRHILIVDDSPMTLRIEKGWFEGKYNVSMANSATMAISFLAKNKPDLILLDHDMPLCSGPQFLEMIHSEENTRDIPVIFLTGKNDSDSVNGALELRPAGYLLKSMEPEAIVKYVDNFFIKLVQQKKINSI